MLSISRVSRHIKMLSLGLLGAFIMAAPVHAQAFPTYTTPVFNTFTGVNGVGDEHDFVRVAPNGSNNYVNDFTNCTDGAVVTVWVYIHNNATEGANGANNDGTGVAKDVNVSVTSAPAYGSTATDFTLTGKISASNAPTATDTAFVKCGNEEFKMDFVSGSAVLLTAAHQSGLALPDSVATSAGATVGSLDLNGVWPGCWEFRGTVRLQVKLTKKPEVVTSKECKALSISKSVVKPGESVTATVTGAATNATITGYIFTVKDKNGNVVDTKEVATNATTATYTFVQNNVGNYTISASVKFADGNVTSDACVKSISVQTTPPPSVIPNTGAGSIIGLLTVTTIAGAIAHRMWTLRKSN